MARTPGSGRIRPHGNDGTPSRTTARRPRRPSAGGAGAAGESVLRLQRLVGNALTKMVVTRLASGPPRARQGFTARPPSLRRGALQRDFIQVEGVQRTPEEWADLIAPAHQRDAYLVELHRLLAPHNEPLILHAMSREKFERLVGEEVAATAGAAIGPAVATGIPAPAPVEPAAAEEWLPAPSKRKPKKKKTAAEKEAQLLTDFDRALDRRIAAEKPSRGKEFGGRLDGFEGMSRALVHREYHGVEITGHQISGLKKGEVVRFYVTGSSKTAGIAFDVSGHIHDASGDTRIPVFVIHIPE